MKRSAIPLLLCVLALPSMLYAQAPVSNNDAAASACLDGLDALAAGQIADAVQADARASDAGQG
jgi:hypothetical protein